MNDIIYTKHAQRRLKERKIGKFCSGCKVARPPILDDIKRRCRAHRQVVRRDSRFVYWYRKRNSKYRDIFVTTFQNVGELLIITAFIIPIEN